VKIKKAKTEGQTKRRVKLRVPIYGVDVLLVVSDDIAQERKTMEHVFGPAPDEHDYDALTSYNGEHFALFFKRKAVSTERIAHEVFHLTHRILEWAGANFDSQHHEQGALLCGYLMATVQEKLRWTST
jgi:hypothetical protein